jgi:hypothetical protein
MNYKLIIDEEELDRFIEWLPDLKPTEKFYVALFARKKYDKLLQSTSSDKMQLKRLLATKENLKLKLSQLEIPYGRYKLKSVKATQQSLALYISPNPRCMIKANKLMLTKTADAILKGNYFYNLHQEALSCVQQSKSYSYVVDFDIDTKNVDLNKLKELDFKYYKVLETRGGYHILIEPQFETEHRSINNLPLNWYQLIRETFEVDIVGDNLLPIPGCTSGNFVPKFITI